eukprot:SAG31_NODE_518_length_14674_cov_39.604803_11_plen_765_part_00
MSERRQNHRTRAMPSSMARRVLEHLARATPAVEPKPPVPPAVRRLASTAPAAARPLSDVQIRSFVASGFLALQLDDVDPELMRHAYELGSAAHLATSGDAGIMPGREGAFDADGPLQPAMDAALSSAVTRGALASLLGADYIGAGPWGGGAGYGGNNYDQAFHKDDTHIPVRDHRVRALSVFFCPGAVTSRMGPTEFLKRSHYLSVDREGMSHGEERLDPVMVGPKNRKDWHAAITSWSGLGTDSLPSLERPGEQVRVPMLDFPERDARLRAAPGILGCEHQADVAQATCREGGTIFIWHNDLFHRKSRQRNSHESQQDGNSLRVDWSRELAPHDADWVPWRMVARFGFERTSQPEPRAVASMDAAMITMDDGADGAAAEFHRRWLGCRPATESGNSHIINVDEDALGLYAELETERIHAAYSLAAAATCADSGVDSSKGSTLVAQVTSALCEAAVSPRESVRRAACYSFAALGQPAIEPLMDLLLQDNVCSPGHTKFNCSFVCLREKYIYALGEAGAAAASHRPSAELMPVVVALADTIAQCRASLQHIVNAIPSQEYATLKAAAVRGVRGFDMEVFAGILPVHREAEEARGVLAEATCALGRIVGSAIVASNALISDGDGVAELAVTALDVLIPLCLEEDLGAALPSRFPVDMLSRNASMALLTMCSGGGFGPGSRFGASAPTLLDGRRAISGYARIRHFPDTPTDVPSRSGAMLALALVRLDASCCDGGRDVHLAMRDKLAAASTEWASIISSSKLERSVA